MIPTVLALDTASPVIGAALIRGAEVRQWSQRIVRGSDAALTPALAELLDGIDRLDAIAVSVGPGAFTSLRVGVAHALGLALARSALVVPVSSLEARAAAAPGTRTLALLDGRKGRAYAGFYAPGLVGEEVDVQPSDAIALADGDWAATGEGALVWAAEVEAAGGHVVDEPAASPALALARLGLARIGAGIAPTGVRLRYLRAPDAKLPTIRYSR
ncbi:MAG TPA: tRNA (adenosine(37)-N6)-threonylcarbamoyltransferase complex dimerization subunit type 1 TsaB [Myxococcota bacterium]|nr:tRNA (adenosine(37)-N6)-threonylcarbamoyltransferase complex dimerization subunit type 1 TsaB [Myxococcota bacterium]